MRPGYTEDWFPFPSEVALAGLAKRAVDGVIVEIGSWEGRSTVALANAAHPRIVHAVDTWAGSPGEISAELAAGRDVYAKFAANIAAFTAGNVETHRMGWREFVPTLTGPVALAFIDAEHSYREVFDNIAALKPLMAPGGIMCGDDIGHPPVQEAVAAHFDPAFVSIDATLWIWEAP